MSKLNYENLKKAIYYMQRNGLRDAYLAALERLKKNPFDTYTYNPLAAQELERQRTTEWKHNIKFSILVPAYQTKEAYLRAMIDSVLQQTYVNLELIIADASKDESVKRIAATYTDSRMIYLPLEDNAGISENTNAALAIATGEYIGLLDHDDILTEDALYEVALKIQEASVKGEQLKILYSDEDKCDENGEKYYEPHIKQEFNLDLILTNNYICHFMVMEAKLMKELRFCKEYDGAQDYDLALRGIAQTIKENEQEDILDIDLKSAVAHIPKVLYHWRCHRGSTAANPKSKLYAYEAGKRSIENFMKIMEWKAQVEALKHVGFYKVNYVPDILTVRNDIGAVGGKLINKRNKITGGIYNQDGVCPLAGMNKAYSGYMHRASLQQDVYAMDIRLVKLRKELWDTFEEIVGIPYAEFDCKELPKDTDYIKLSLELSKKIQEKNYRILWNPNWMEVK